MCAPSRIKYPVGVQSFEEIISEGYLYVDKSELVYRLVNDNKYIFLSRPRRFGKSLLISTLEAYFRGRKELFRGLAMERMETEWTEHPVLRLDLTGRNYESCEDVTKGLSVTLEEWEREYSLEARDYSVGDRFYNVIRAACKKCGRKVVILIDEYDKPIIDALHDRELQEKVRSRLQGFYSVIKKADEYIRFAMLTGVGKFAHLSIFSGLNNLSDISMDYLFNAICGISEREMHEYFGDSVKDYAHTNCLTEEETWGMFKKYYDGYHFSKNGEDIYNPFSVLNAFSKKAIGDYWFRSGTPSFLVKLVRRNNIELGVLDNTTATESQLNNITDNTSNIVPLLYQAGYLTLKGWNEEYREYRLGFPNEEVSRGFWDFFINSYFPEANGSLTRDIDNGETDKFMERLASLIADTPVGGERNKEIHFHNIMAIIGKMLGYRIQTEVVSSLGRCDMVIESRRYIYIFEFKINRNPEAALAQIIEKGYARPYMADPREKILIGANFSTESRTLTGWVIA